MLVPLGDGEPVAITSEITVDAPTARAWIRGRGILPGEDWRDIWPHLPEAERRKHVTETDNPADLLPLLVAGWFNEDAVAARVAAADEQAARKRDREGHDG